MDTLKTGSGHCLCEKVSFTTETLSNSVGACHCSMCTRWTGGPYMAIDCGVDVQFSGEDYISRYNSSEWAERGFCKHCGTHLFYRLKQNNQHIMPLGLLDNNEGLVFDHQIFVDEKSDIYCFSNKTKEMTGAEVFAQYAP